MADERSTGTARVKRGLAEMLRGGVIMDVVTAALIDSIIAGSLMRATPPSRRMSAGTRSRAMTAAAATAGWPA